MDAACELATDFSRLIDVGVADVGVDYLFVSARSMRLQRAGFIRGPFPNGGRETVFRRFGRTDYINDDCIFWLRFAGRLIASELPRIRLS